MKIKAILFDMDGVLIEAKEWHYKSLNKALNLFGMPISKADHITTFDGLPTRKKLEILSIENNLPKELHEFINEMKQQYTMDMVQIECKPVFIHEYALSKLKAMGYKTAVCSNSIRQTVVSMMNKSNLSSYMDVMISNEDVKFGKPDPEMYLMAIDYFKFLPEECLIVEDNEHGIKAARASGAHVFVVRNTVETNLNNILNKIKEIELRESP